MYSSALNLFKNYIVYTNDKQFRAELIKDAIEYEKNITQNIAHVSGYARNIVDRVQDKPNFKTVKNGKIWSRNPRYASDAIADASYLCEFDGNHDYFISKYSQKSYVEAHHLIPMKYQGQFECSLDIHANIVSICLVCHKKIHFGMFEDKIEILEKLFNSRRERLIKSGINISLDELYIYYLD